MISPQSLIHVASCTPCGMSCIYLTILIKPIDPLLYSFVYTHRHAASCINIIIIMYLLSSLIKVQFYTPLKVLQTCFLLSLSENTWDISTIYCAVSMVCDLWNYYLSLQDYWIMPFKGCLIQNPWGSTSML